MRYFPVLLVFSAASFCSFNEDQALWNMIDTLKASMEVPGTISDTEIQGLFRQALETAVSSELGQQMEDLRADAFQSGDFTVADSYVLRAAPVITVLLAGESNNIGVNVHYFLEKSDPDGEAHTFFDLAADGFYFDRNSPRPGTSELPVWLERAGSSAQAIVEEDLSEIYLRIWQGYRIDFSGYFGELADETIAVLSGDV